MKWCSTAADALPARAIVIATGAQYNKPRLANLEKFEGEGIYYGATYIESQLCEQRRGRRRGRRKFGGAGRGVSVADRAQSAHAGAVGRIVEHDVALSDSANDRKSARSNCISTRKSSALEGDTHLERVMWRDKKTGETSTHDIRHVFIMTGASPRTEWLRGCVAMDDKGFILTGRDLDAASRQTPNPHWPLARAPQMLETSLPGVFAVGDVRAGNVKRVASAVGEGAISIHLVHRALSEM